METPKPAERETDLSWLYGLTEKWGKVRLAQEAVGLGQATYARLFANSLAVRSATGQGELPRPEDMNIPVGNEYHIVNEAPKGSALGKAAMTAALLVGGGGLGYLAANGLPSMPPPAAGDTDTDTSVLIEALPGE